jgi:hypothetical protein
MLKGLRKWKLDFLSDHSMRQYAENIAIAVDKELCSLSKGGQATQESEIVIPEQSH